MSAANFSQQVFYRHFTILEIQLNCTTSFDTHFMLFRSLCKSFHTTLYNKSGKLIAIYFCKHNVDICKTTICDPAFLSIHQIVFSIFTKNCRSFCTQCITSTSGFCKTISTFPLTCCQFWNIFLFLIFRSKIKNRQCTYTCVCSYSYAK